MAARKRDSSPESDDQPEPVFYEVADGILIFRFSSSKFTLPEAEIISMVVYEKFDGIVRNVIVNLNGVDYIDSAAISLVVRITNEMGLRIVNVGASVEKILKKIQIYDLLYILKSEYEARKSYTGA
ncbi:MAG: STAS domain-containing protein [Candidatus Dadabacteria bacterium]|nr:STAS domain-containing protein [Candidatus Dadabacteria bacterium]